MNDLSLSNSKISSNYVLGKDYYFFHSFVGNNTQTFRTLMFKACRDPDSEAFFNFFYGGKTVDEVEKSLGLDLREIICCVSKTNPAVVYHRPFGLILSGEPSVVFDYDSGTYMQPDGTYLSKSFFNFSKKTTIDNLLTSWYDDFSKREAGFVWNEVFLKKGSKIVGAFHDPNYDPNIMLFSHSTFKEKEYSHFLKKVRKLGLDLLEINAKYK